MKAAAPTRIALATLALACTSQAASAEDLAHFIDDLYGGNGIILPPAPGIPDFIAAAHQPHFLGEAQIAALSALNKGIVAGAGNFALNSTVAGVSFDLSKGVPVAVNDSLGPLLTERASTLGKGRLSLAFGYSSNDFSELDGEDLGHMQVQLTHQDCCDDATSRPPPDGDLSGFEEDTIQLDIDIDIKQEVYAFFGTYGITDKWDIGAVVPVVSVDASAYSVASIIEAHPDGASEIAGNPIHSFATDPSAAISETGGSETGLGDAVLRTKYQFMSESEGCALDLAVLGQVTLATGDEDNLLGTGESRYKGVFIASKTYGRWTPHVNLGYETSSGDDELDNYSYAVGLDTRINNRFSTAVAVIGRNNPDLEEIGNNLVDAAVSVKWNPFQSRNAPLNAFVKVPLNDDGLRSDYVWGVGAEIIFD